MYSPTPVYLRSLNDCNVRPKRTSYSNMSTWFFMDKKNADYEKDDFSDVKNILFQSIFDGHLPKKIAL